MYIIAFIVLIIGILKVLLVLSTGKNQMERIYSEANTSTKFVDFIVGFILTDGLLEILISIFILL